MNDDAVSILTEIRNLIRASSYGAIKSLLESALVDTQSRSAYQLLDGKASMDEVRIACKMSPNKLIALTQKWISMGLIELKLDKKRRRLFDLTDYGLVDTPE